MKQIIRFSKDAREYLKEQQAFIAIDNPKQAKKYILKLVRRIETLLSFPHIGKVNLTYKDESIREIFVEGYKIIYKLEDHHILVLIIYKRIDIDEFSLELDQ